MTSNSHQSIKNWTYTLPKNCSPVENFLLAMKTELEMLESTQSHYKIHVVLDARQVSSISTYNKMKMDAFWKKYDSLIMKYIHYTTLFVDTEKQKIKLDKIYRQSKSTSPYRVILASQMQQSNEVSNNTLSMQVPTSTSV
jgi:hypothetical protein